MPINLYQTTASSNLPTGASFMDATAGVTYLVNVLQDLKATIRQVALNDPWTTLLGLTSSNWTGSLAWTYISATQASIQGDQSFATGTGYLAVGQRVRAIVTAGNIYGQITAVSVASNITTVTFVWDSGQSLDTGLSDIQTAGTGALQAVLNNIVTQTQVPLYCVITNGGSGAAFTGALLPVITAYLVGQDYRVKWTQASQGSDTINLNSIGALNVKKIVNGALVATAANDIPAGGITDLVYDGTQLILINGINQTPTTVYGLWGSRHLVATAAGGGTTLPITADLVMMWNPSTGALIEATSFSATVNIGTSGPALNGRDQSGSFGNNTFFHVYAISGSGQTSGLIASLTAPPTGPALPTNYTNWAYLGTFITDGSGNIVAGVQNGNKWRYATRVSVLNTTTAESSPTSQSVSSAVPSLATIWSGFTAVGATGGGGNVTTVVLQFVSGDTYLSYTSQEASVSSGLQTNFFAFDMPQVSQQFYYTLTIGTSGAALTIWVLGYEVPNGA